MPTEVETLRDLARAYWAGKELRCPKHPASRLTGTFVQTTYADHIEDIETSLAEYLDVLEQRRFVTLPECERTASAEMSQFPRTMDGFKLRSNAKRHPR